MGDTTPPPDGTIPTARPRRWPQPMCPVRAGDPCTLCIPGATGPQDCPIVQLVMDDPELKQRAHELRQAQRTARPRD